MAGLRKYKSLWSSTSNSFGTGTGETVTPASVTGLPTDTELVLTFDRNVTGKIERIRGQISGGNFGILERGVDGTTEQAHTSPTVEMIWNAADWNDAIDSILAQHTASGTHTAITASSINGNTVPSGTDTVALLTASQTLTNKTLTSPTINTPTITGGTFSGTFTGGINGPRGFGTNYKIVPSVASNNLTVALKGLDGNDPSATNPVYVRIGDTVQAITAALSITRNAGTNWFNSGSTELATKEVDYFVYLGYNATDGVVLGFSPFPFASEYSEFSATTTNQKHCAISTITNAAAGDDYEVIGRFAATLSAGAGYTWTVPTFTNINLIQYPIRETRLLLWNCTYAGINSMTIASPTEIECNYQLIGGKCKAHWGRVKVTVGGTPSAAITATLPKVAALANDCWAGASCYTNSAYKGGMFTETSTLLAQIRLYDGAAWTAGDSYFGGELSFNLG